MIRKKGELFKEVRENMRGGKGEVELLHLFQQEELQGHARLCALIRLEPGSSIGYHQHVDEEEIYYFLRGKGRYTENGQIQVVEPGDAVLTQGGESHSIESIGDEPLEMMAVVLLYT